MPEPETSTGTAHSYGACRACGNPSNPFLSLGDLPLANALVAPDAPAEADERFPLTLTLCQQCRLVQLADSIDPERMFRKYVYRSSTSAAFLRHTHDLADRMIAERRLGPGSRVIEIASNDGYMLRRYRAAGIPVLGVDPARNIAEVARRDGIETVAEFFSPELAARICREGPRADVVHAHNVLGHVPDLGGVVAGMASILADNGLVVVEVPWLLDLVDNLEFDTIYHEHLSYFTLTALMPLFARYRLSITRAEQVAVHGGSLRLFAQHAGAAGADASVDAMLGRERRWGIFDDATFRRFAGAVRAYPPLLRDFLGGLRRDGRSIAAYGASAKGAMLLNYCGVGRDLLDFVADRSALKHGLTMPGLRVPIFPADELCARQPDFALLLAWNFAEEILREQAEYRKRGGRFILPLTKPHIAPE